MKAKLVKFNEDGTSCNNDIQYLKRHPNCGIPFIQDKPFQPVKPINVFKPHDRKFSIDVLNRIVPLDPDIPDAPPMGVQDKQGEAVGSSPYTNIYLPQDYTTYSNVGRRLVGVDNLEFNTNANYVRASTTEIPYAAEPIGNNNFTHQTPEEPSRPVGDVELEDFGAGTGIRNNEPRPLTTTRIRPIPDPRNSEFLSPRGTTDEELIDMQIEQISRGLTPKERLDAERNINKIRGKAKARVTPKPVEQEMFPVEPDSEENIILQEIDKILRPNETELSIRQKDNLIREMESRGISRQRVEEILERANAFDFAMERAVGGSSRGSDIERLARRLKSSISEIPTRDSNLLPSREEFMPADREDTPFRGRETGLESGTRSRTQKVMDKVAGRLPEELRSVYKSAQRSATQFNENISNRTQDAVQNIRTTQVRIFGQQYTNIQSEAIEARGGIQLQEPGNVNIRPPATEDITGIRANDVGALDFDPLGADYQETFTGRARPTLNFAERLQGIRSGAFTGETGVASSGAVGGVLIGFGVSELMKKAGVHNKYAIAAGAGASGGAGARILTMAGSRALTRSVAREGTEAVIETAAYTAIRGGTSMLRGAAEGGIIGIALMPVDFALNNSFVNAGLSHGVSNVLSGTIVGATGTAVSTIGLASLGAAPETLGASLVVGAIAMGITGIIGAISGVDQDNKERAAKEKAEKARNELNSTSSARQKLLATLPNYDFNFNRALAAYNDKDALGIDDDTWSVFQKNVGSMFVEKPSNTQKPTPTSGDAPTGEIDKLNNLFSKYITHELITRVCTDDTGCEQLKQQDKGELTNDEIKFLNDKTGSSWQGQANMQVEMSVQELQYTRERIATAQTSMLNSWNNDKKVANQLDPYLVETANLDPDFRAKYELALKLDAQQQVVDAYQTDQTKLEQLPINIRNMANLDPEFDSMIHAYYSTMETTSSQLDITIPQLITLQGLDESQQKDKYQQFQFDKIKQDTNVVSETIEISREEDQVRDAGFYDIDQAFLETNPTDIASWHPSDSQILQAHAAGMNLNEYVNYMHELAKGAAGDYSKLPKFTEAQERASGLLDYSHFQDELQMAGYRKDLYAYNADTRQFTLNPNITNSGIPSTQSTFISRYTPRYLLEARQQYADMVHGLNQKNQNEVDNFNNNLLKELSAYGRNYDSIVGNINDQRLYEGRSDLLFYNVGKLYDQNKIEFKQLSENLDDTPSSVSRSDSTKRNLAQQTKINKKFAAAERYGITVNEYNAVKADIQSKNQANPTPQQVQQAIQEVKSSPPNAPPLAS